MPKPKTIAIVIAIVIAINVAIYYWSRSMPMNSALMPPAPSRAARRPMTMAEGASAGIAQGGREIRDESGALAGYDFT